MATVDQQSGNNTFSSDAIDVLDSFSSSFDEILSEIAEGIALERQSTEVTKQDVISAARLILSAVNSSD